MILVTLGQHQPLAWLFKNYQQSKENFSWCLNKLYTKTLRFLCGDHLMTLIDPNFKTINPIKDRLLSGEILYGGWASMGSIIATEILGHSGFDWVLLDGEHGNNHYENLVTQLLALNTGPSAAFVRPEVNSPYLLKRMMDFGFYNFLIPMVETAELAIQAVQATRYPPEGIRGVSVSTRSNRFGMQSDYFSVINQRICVAAQIETATSIENIEAIAAVPGIDCLFVGPQDLAASLGYLAKPSADGVQAVIRQAISRINACNKPAGILAADTEEAIRYREWGCRFIAISSDQSLIRRGAAKILAAMKT